MKYTYDQRIRLLDQVHQAEQRLAAAIQELENYDNPYGGEGYFADGDVLRFKMRYTFRGVLYTFAVVRAEGMWYPTGKLGQKGNKPHTWKELCGVWKTYSVAPESIEVLRGSESLCNFQEPF